MNTKLYTIGHSNRALSTFLELLGATAIGCVVDVRALPSSRRHPHFSRASLERSLATAGMAYQWAGEVLGGRRSPRADSPHTALPAAVRGFADHMQSSEFLRALEALMAAARAQRMALMCAEKKPCDCHRALIADALTARGVEVLHIIDAEQIEPARLDHRARGSACGLVYDRGAQGSFL